MVKAFKRYMPLGFLPLFKLLPIALAAILLTGCLLPKERMDIPKTGVLTRHAEIAETAENNRDTTENGAEPASISAEKVLGPDWWQAFQSEELGSLIDRGLSQNADIRIALSRMVQLKARYVQASAGKKPSLSAPLAAANQAPGSTAVGTAPTGQQTGTNSGNSKLIGQKTYQASIRADWRLDIWGEQAALADSAEFQLQRAIHERANVERNLTANITASYLEYLSLNDRLRIAEATETVLQATLVILEKRLTMGDATLSELEQQKAAIFSLRATIPTLEQQRFEVLTALAMLVGVTPGELLLSDAGLDSLTPPATPLTAFSSVSLMQRPDIRAAEAQLLAARADIDVARARILPTIDLAAQSGSSSALASNLFLPGTLFWNVVANLSVNLFDGGRRKGERQFTQAVKEEMVESYVRTIYQAARETENSKSAVQQTARRLSAHKAASEAAKRAWEINRKIFDMGSLDYLSLLDTQRSYNRYLDDFQKTRAEFFKAQIPILQLISGMNLGNTEASEVLTPDIPRFDDAQFDPGTEFWQVELENATHASALSPLWRDLTRRFPNFMDGRMIRPKLLDSVEYKTTGKQAWYQVVIARFGSPDEALQLCNALQPQQRCRVISSNSDTTILAH
ncbi:MAG: hypothetical protein RIR18_502 [Pseudomonadota bacterium]